MKVRVTGIVDPLPNPETERPKAGRRFVGVRMTLTNAGDQPYRDAPLNGSMLVTDLPKAANPTILIGGNCPPSSAPGCACPPAPRSGCASPSRSRRRRRSARSGSA